MQAQSPLRGEHGIELTLPITAPTVLIGMSNCGQHRWGRGAAIPRVSTVSETTSSHWWSGSSSSTINDLKMCAARREPDAHCCSPTLVV
jgi:hypothetical protein